MTRDETKTFVILKYGSMQKLFALWVVDEIKPSAYEMELINEYIENLNLYHD